MRTQLHFKSVAAFMVATVAGLSFVSAEAASPAFGGDSYFAQKRNAVKPVRPYKGKKVWDVNAFFNQRDFKSGGASRLATEKPVISYNDQRYYDYLEAPDGSSWFYIATYEVEKFEYSEWYTEERIVSYRFEIYDPEFNLMGVIKDKVTLGEDETKVVSAVLDPAVSYHFFNTDDKPEVMVYLAVNTTFFTNNYYNKVYSIGGETDAEGNNECLLTIDGRCVDAFNAAAPSEPENYYYTFVGEEESEDLDADYSDLVEFLNSYYMPVTTYGSAVDNSGPVEVITKKIYMTRIPGDTTDGIYLISKPTDGKAYFIYSQYEKPYFIDPTGGAMNEDPTPDNSFIIEVYRLDGNTPSLVSETKIPVKQEVSSDHLLYTFYSVGSLAWKDDIDMMVYGSKEAPAFVVARDVMNAATYEEVVANYEIYGNDGKLLKEISENTDGIMVFESDGDSEPEILFVVKDSEGAYTFNVKGMYTGTLLMQLDQDNTGDPISASCNRVKMADGSYKYVFEMTYYDADAEGNEYIRLAWFNSDGKLDHIDSLNMGKDVMAASVNIYAECLNPYLYDDDDAMEYAVLVKRMHGETTRNEFIVVDDNGEWYANFSEDDNRGEPRMFTILPGEPNNLMMVYAGDNGYNVDIYSLPFTSKIGDKPGDDPDDTAVDSIGAENKVISFRNNQISAHGCKIEVMSVSGMRSAKGNNSVNVETLPTGVYVVTATDASGNRSIAKINKR